jgi:hypothetical protein
MPYTEIDYITLAILPSYLNGLKRKECYFDLGRDRASGMDGVLTLSFVGRVLLKSRMWEIHKSGSERGRSATGIWKRYCGTIAKADGKLRTRTSS